MKRDMDLVRQILITMSENERGPNIKWAEALPDYAEDVILHHAHLMSQGGLIDAIDVTSISHLLPVALPTSITWDGHEFLDSSRDPTVWDKAKKYVIKPAGGVAMSVLTEWLKAQAKGAITS